MCNVMLAAQMCSFRNDHIFQIVFIWLSNGCIITFWLSCVLPLVYRWLCSYMTFTWTVFLYRSNDFVVAMNGVSWSDISSIKPLCWSLLLFFSQKFSSSVLSGVCGCFVHHYFFRPFNSVWQSMSWVLDLGIMIYVLWPVKELSIQSPFPILLPRFMCSPLPFSLFCVLQLDTKLWFSLFYLVLSVLWECTFFLALLHIVLGNKYHC